MGERWLADAVVVFHFAFVLFAVLGALGVWRWPRLAWLHLPAVAWAGLVELAGWPCPLTALENHWRELAGEASAGGFVERALVPILYPEALTREIQLALGGGVLLLNALAYAAILGGRREPAPRAPRR